MGSWLRSSCLKSGEIVPHRKSDLRLSKRAKGTEGGHSKHISWLQGLAMWYAWIWQVKLTWLFVPTHLINQDKDSMRETVRKKESDRNSHMEMERRRCMQGRLGKQVMGTENVREDLGCHHTGSFMGSCHPVTSTDVQRHSWRNHISMYRINPCR